MFPKIKSKLITNNDENEFQRQLDDFLPTCTEVKDIKFHTQSVGTPSCGSMYCQYSVLILYYTR